MGLTPQQYRDLCARLNLDPITGGLPKAHKHNARKKELDGITFASTAEARRYVELKAMASAGVIADLTLQPQFLLQEAFRDAQGKWHRKVEYWGDFRYTQDGEDIVEDVKGQKLPVFAMKWKLVIARYPHIAFRLVR